MSEVDRPQAARRPFRLTRHFSVTSLLGLVTVLVALLLTYRAIEALHLVDHESRAHADLARVLGHALWEPHHAHLTATPGRGRDALVAGEAHARLDADVRRHLSGLQVVKLKLYDLSGTTVYSTEAAQIGEDRGANVGFRAARDGQVHSALSHRDTVDTLAGTTVDRDLIASYLPLRRVPGGPVEAVVEIYSDVTDLQARQARAQWQMGGVVLALLTALYLYLLGIVRQADRIIARQARDREVAEARVRHQATHDALTGLPNRPAFGHALDDALCRGPGALLFVDLDRFKFVNDSLGHGAGDDLLRIVAGRLRDALAPEDRLFRLGGDEFTVLVGGDCDEPALVHRARRILAAAGEPLRLHDHDVAVGASVGIARHPQDATTADALVRCADAAMYRAKADGRGRHAFWTPDLAGGALRRLGLEAQALAALRRGEFVLHYQPRLDSARREVVAVEALLRWNHPAHGLLLPGEFVESMETAGLMQAVGDWVLRTACEQQRRWVDAGLRPVRMSVNVSASQFEHADFAETVARIVADTGIGPSWLELELTESMLVTRPRQAQRTLAALKALGVRTSIDDFGTGYSSLSYLRQFAVDGLKIDRSFVAEVADHPRDRAVASAIIELAQALGIEVVAEGIETEAQAEFFTRARCHELQGWLFSRAEAPEALGAWMARATAPAPALPRPTRSALGMAGGFAPQAG